MNESTLSDPEYAEACAALAIAQRRYDDAVSALGAAEQREFRQLGHVTFEDRVRLLGGPLSPLHTEVTEAGKVLDRVKARVNAIRSTVAQRAKDQAKAIEDAALKQFLGE